MRFAIRLGAFDCSALLPKGFARSLREDTALFRKDLGLLQQFFMAKDEHGVVQARPWLNPRTCQRWHAGRVPRRVLRAAQWRLRSAHGACAAEHIRAVCAVSAQPRVRMLDTARP